MDKQKEKDSVETVDSGAALIEMLSSECVEISYHLDATPIDGEEVVFTFSEDTFSSCDLDPIVNDFNKYAAVRKINQDLVEVLDAEDVQVSQGKDGEEGDVHVSRGKDGVERANDFKKPREDEFECSTECTAFDAKEPTDDVSCDEFECSTEWAAFDPKEPTKTDDVICDRFEVGDGFTFRGESNEVHIARVQELLNRHYALRDSVIEVHKSYYDNSGQRIMFGLEKTESGYKQVCLRDGRYQDYLGDLDDDDTVNGSDANGSLGKQNEDAIEALCSESKISTAQDECGDHCTCKDVADMADLNLDVPGMVAVGEHLDVIGLVEKQNVEADNVDSDVLCFEFQSREGTEIALDRDGAEEAFDANEPGIGERCVISFSNESKAIGKQSGKLFEVADSEAVCIKSQDNEGVDPEAVSIKSQDSEHVDSEAVCIKSQNSEGVEITYNMKKTKDGDEFVYTFSDNKVGLDSESTALYQHDLDHGFDKYGVLGEQNEEANEIASSEVHH